MDPNSRRNVRPAGSLSSPLAKSVVSAPIPPPGAVKGMLKKKTAPGLGQSRGSKLVRASAWATMRRGGQTDLLSLVGDAPLKLTDKNDSGTGDGQIRQSSSPEKSLEIPVSQMSSSPTKPLLGSHEKGMAGCDLSPIARENSITMDHENPCSRYGTAMSDPIRQASGLCRTLTMDDTSKSTNRSESVPCMEHRQPRRSSSIDSLRKEKLAQLFLQGELDSLDHVNILSFALSMANKVDAERINSSSAGVREIQKENEMVSFDKETFSAIFFDMVSDDGEVDSIVELFAFLGRAFTVERKAILDQLENARRTESDLRQALVGQENKWKLNTSMTLNQVEHDLESATDQITSANQEISSLRRKSSLKERQLTESRKEADRLVTELEDLQNEFEATKIALQQSISARNSEQEKSSQQALEIKEMEAKCKDLQAQVDALESRNNSLVKERTMYESEHPNIEEEIELLNNTLMKLQSENIELQRSQHTLHQDYFDETEGLNRTIDLLREQLENAGSPPPTIEQELFAKEMFKAMSPKPGEEGSLVDTIAELLDLQRQNQELREFLESEKSNSESLRAQISELDSKFLITSKNQSAVEEELSRANSDIAMLRQRENVLNSKLIRHEVELQLAKTQLEQQKQTVSDAEVQAVPQVQAITTSPMPRLSISPASEAQDQELISYEINNRELSKRNAEYAEVNRALREDVGWLVRTLHALQKDLRLKDEKDRKRIEQQKSRGQAATGKKERQKLAALSTNHSVATFYR